MGKNNPPLTTFPHLPRLAPTCTSCHFFRPLSLPQFCRVACVCDWQTVFAFPQQAKCFLLKTYHTKLCSAQNLSHKTVLFSKPMTQNCFVLNTYDTNTGTAQKHKHRPTHGGIHKSCDRASQHWLH